MSYSNQDMDNLQSEMEVHVRYAKRAAAKAEKALADVTAQRDELLAACEAALRESRDGRNDLSERISLLPSHVEAMLESAIARARGES